MTRSLANAVNRRTAVDSPGYDPQGSEREPQAAITTLDMIAVPEVTYVLVAAGLLCIVVRLATPALGWSGVAAGSTLLLIGSAGLLTLPVRAVGLLMLSFAAASLCMEVLAFPGFGLHAVGGALSLVLTGVYLTEDPPGVHPVLVVPVAVAVAAITYLAGRRSWRCIRDRPLDPSPKLVGRGTVVLAGAGSIGLGVVSGQLWDLRTKEGDLRAGQTVRVTEAADGWLVVQDAPDFDRW
jgi:membrane-bound ClpP family serine protease